MPLLMVKYLSKNPQGKWQYRRDLPAALRPVLGKREIKKVLGETQAQALAAYTQFHSLAEKLISSAKAGGTKALEAYLQAKLKEFGISPETPRDERWEWASNYLDRFDIDMDTGDPIIPTDRQGWLYEAILEGRPILPPPTLRDALDFYALENVKDNDTANRELSNRLTRAYKLAVEALGKDKELQEFTRADSRSIREHFLKMLKPQSARRYIGQLAAAYNLIDREKELGLKPVFKGISESIKIPKADKKVPLPDRVADTIAEVIKAQARDKRLLLVWNLCRTTGARIGEMAGLRHRDLKLDDPIPLIMVRYAEGRSIKNKSSERVLPLLAPEVSALKVYLSSHPPQSLDDPVFGNWGLDNGNDRASAALSDYVRMGKAQYYANHPLERPLPSVLAKMTLHSLRHAITDKCRIAGVDSELRKCLTGHAQGGMDSIYGNGPNIEKLREAVEKANEIRIDHL